MHHLTNDNLYRLATLLSQELSFEREDMLLMQHTFGCPQCSAMLKRSVAIVDATDHMAEFCLLSEQDKMAEPVKESAVIQIVILDARAMMTQLQKDTSHWMFQTPLKLAGKRSVKGDDAAKETLVDFDNSKTFISFDREKKVLLIQVDGRNGEAPNATLKEKNGTIHRISFEKLGSVFRAEVQMQEQGEYELFIEK